MKIDTKVLKYACTLHGVKCVLNGKTVQIHNKTLSLGQELQLRPGQGNEYLDATMTLALEEIIPKRRKEPVLDTYRKVLRVKLNYCKTSLTEATFQP